MNLQKLIGQFNQKRLDNFRTKMLHQINVIIFDNITARNRFKSLIDDLCLLKIKNNKWYIGNNVVSKRQLNQRFYNIKNSI